MSHPQDVKQQQGCPMQGSTLSPLLLLLYIKDSIIIYANYSQIYSAHDTYDEFQPDASTTWPKMLNICVHGKAIHIIQYLWNIRDKFHWLPIQQRIKFKFGVLVYRCLHGTALPYLQEMLKAVADIAGRRSLRSAAHGELGIRDLVVPRSKTVRFGSRMFAVSGPTFWNSLTNELKNSSLTEPAFEKQLKTFLFRTAQSPLTRLRNGVSIRSFNY